MTGSAIRRAGLVLVGSAALFAPAAASIAAPIPTNEPAAVRSATLDESKLARVIKAKIVKGLGKSVPVTVTCQRDIPIKKGRKSTCTARIGTQVLTYNVKQTSNDGDVTYKRTKAVLDLRKAEKEIAKQVAQQVGGSWKLTCKPIGSQRFYVIGVGKSFTCPIKGTNGDGDDQTGLIRVTATDLTGAISWRSI